MPKALPPQMHDFIHATIWLCAVFNCSVTSWIRTPKRNAAKGGDPESKHLSGMGIDLVPDEARQWPKVIEAARALGLTAVDEGDHIHVQIPRGTAFIQLAENVFPWKPADAAA